MAELGAPSGKQPRDEEESGDEDGGDSDGSEIDRPRKRFHRQRAHHNPLATCHIWRPDTPALVPYGEFYPALKGSGAVVRWLDLGCGFGSLLLELAKAERTELILGMEIRKKLVIFDQKRIVAARKQAAREKEPRFTADNVWAVEANSMKCMPNYFERAQLTKLFICFPDPHFKKRNVRRRVVSPALLAEYAYCLAPGSLLYTITDVSELTDWMVEHLTAFPLFTRLANEQLVADPLVPLLLLTDEGLKVARNNGNMFIAVFERLAAPKTEPEPLLGREVSAAAASTAGYTPKPGGELRGKTW